VSLALLVNGPEGLWKLAGGVSHRIMSNMKPAPEGTAETGRFPAPLPGRILFSIRSGGSRHRLVY